MELVDRIVVVTGGASGIGAVLSRRFLDEGARAVVVADREGEAAAAVARDLGDRARAISADVGVEADVDALVERTEDEVGPIDLFVSNAGHVGGGGIGASDEVWANLWQVNVMGHLYAARAVIPRMVERGGGYLLTNASAAGLLSLPGNAPYSVTKHAAVALTEWISFTYGDAGIRTSCLCSLSVDTPKLKDTMASPQGRMQVSYGVTSTAEVADAVVEGIRDERFLILPQPEVATFEQQRADDREGWLAGMRRVHHALESAAHSGVDIDLDTI